MTFFNLLMTILQIWIRVIPQDPSYSSISVTLKYLILYRMKLKKIYYGTEFGTKTRRKKSVFGVKIK